MKFFTLVENEKFSLVYSKDTHIFHFFIYYNGKDFAHQKVLDATGLVWRCTTFPTKSCTAYFDDFAIAKAMAKLRWMRAKQRCIMFFEVLCERIFNRKEI